MLPCSVLFFHPFLWFMKHYDLETSTIGHLLVWSRGCGKIMFPRWFATVFFNLDRSFSHLKEKCPLQVENVGTLCSGTHTLSLDVSWYMELYVQSTPHTCRLIMLMASYTSDCSLSQTLFWDINSTCHCKYVCNPAHPVLGWLFHCILSCFFRQMTLVSL